MTSIQRRAVERAKAMQRRARYRALRPVVTDWSWHMTVSGPRRVASSSERINTYAALGLLDQRHGLRQSHLAAAELKVFSQNGEDGIIMEIMSRIGVTTGHFIEFGIDGGREGNCVLLADVLGWSGLFIEGDPGLYSTLSSKYSSNSGVSTRCAFVAPQNVNDLLADQPADTDIVSIDIDGQDYWVWRALSVIQPKLLVIEYNSGLDPRDNKVEPLGTLPNLTKTSGASIGALRALGDAKGYTLAYLELCGVNAFFVRNDYADRFPDPVIYRTPNYLLSGLSHPGVGPTLVTPEP
jgi:hypothetical protein